ncbi:unnamed protein product [Sphagnum balticum]
MSVPHQRLEVPEIPGYHLHWFLEKNVPRALQAAYEFVEDSEVPVHQRGVATSGEVSGSADLGSRIRILAGVSELSLPEYHVLMKLREEYWLEDRAEIDKAHALKMGGIFRGEEIVNPQGAEQSGSDANLRYVKATVQSANWDGKGRLYHIDSGDVNAYYVGDPVSLKAGTATIAGEDLGLQTLNVGQVGGTNVGVVLAVGTIGRGGPYIDPNNLTLLSAPAAKSKPYYALVADDPNIVFEIQEQGGGTVLTVAATSKNANFALAAPATGVNLSGAYLNNNTAPATTSTYNLKLLGLAQKIDPATGLYNTYGTYAKWWCLLNNTTMLRVELVYNEHPTEYTELYDVQSSEMAYEQDVEITGFGLAPVKPEGAAGSYDYEIQGFVATYTHIAYQLGYIVTFEELRDNLYEQVSRRRAKANAFSVAQTLEQLGASLYNDAFTGQSS